MAYIVESPELSLAMINDTACFATPLDKATDESTFPCAIDLDYTSVDRIAGQNVDDPDRGPVPRLWCLTNLGTLMCYNIIYWGSSVDYPGMVKRLKKPEVSTPMKQSSTNGAQSAKSTPQHTTSQDVKTSHSTKIDYPVEVQTSIKKSGQKKTSPIRHKAKSPLESLMPKCSAYIKEIKRLLQDAVRFTTEVKVKSPEALHFGKTVLSDDQRNDHKARCALLDSRLNTGTIHQVLFL